MGTPEDMVIRPATISDAEAVAGIYNPYVRETTITFEETEVSPKEIARRIQEVDSASLPWLVAQQDDRIVGYAYAAKWHSRSAYRFSAEITVYVASGQQRAGVGTRLYEHLFPVLRNRGITSLVVTGVTTPEKVQEALERGACFSFSKPLHFAALGHVVDSLIADRRQRPKGKRREAKAVPATSSRGS